MILLLGGTKDSRDLTRRLIESNFPVTVSVTSQYGSELIEDNVLINKTPLDKDGLTKYIDEHRISFIADASHPYAAKVSANAMDVAAKLGIPYVRYERPSIVLPDYEQLYQTCDYAEAAKVASTLGKTIFLTTGSRHLAIFKKSTFLKNHRIIARVLPEPTVVSECINLGFQPCDIVALQGPFTHDLNTALFKAYNADVIITKNSGTIGGTDAKISAAIALHIPILIINRPSLSYHTLFTSLDDTLNYIRGNYKLCNL